MSVLYLTPGKFRNMGTGIDLSTYTDQALANLLAGASARVNALCAAPNLPQPHDFRGGAITGEQHRWYLGNEWVAASRRFYPSHPPIIAISRLRIKVTENSYIEISPADLFINRQDNYVEVVALTLGIGVFPIVANLGLTQPIAEMDYTYGSALQTVGAMLYTADNLVFRAPDQWWLGSPAPVIYKNGVLLGSGFTIQSDEGTITFGSAQSANDVFTADYSHKLPQGLAKATSLIAVDSIGQSNLNAALGGLGSVRVAEVEIRRPVLGKSSLAVADWALSPTLVEAATELEPYMFHNVAGY